jgi:hypothetical protein
MDIVSPEKYLEEIFHTQIPSPRRWVSGSPRTTGVPLSCERPLRRSERQGPPSEGACIAVLVLAAGGFFT